MSEASLTPLDARLVLRATIDGAERSFPVRAGLTFGAASLCDVPVKATPADSVAAIIFDDMGECVLRSDVMIRRPNGLSTSVLCLADGLAFTLGDVDFLCTVRPQAVEPIASSVDTDRHACPRCRSSLLELDPVATFCPHCGAELPPHCPAWPVLPQDAPPPAPRVHWWTKWLPAWLRSRIDPLFFGRRTTVLAYINTMFNLGLRSESGVHGAPNYPEAGRYYRKAARLGNIPARVRLKLKRF